MTDVSIKLIWALAPMFVLAVCIGMIALFIWLFPDREAA